MRYAPEHKQKSRQRVLAAAAREIRAQGPHQVAVAAVMAKAGLTQGAFYSHFASKDDLVVAFLQERERRWTFEWVEAQARQRGETAEEHLLGIFDLFDEWFRREDFEGCSFINVLLEMSAAHPAGTASVGHLENIRGVVAQLAQEAGLRDPDEFARSWHILMKGSIVQAAEGDVDAARRAQHLARLLIAEHRREARL